MTQTPALAIDIPAMVAGYLDCALWSSTTDDGTPFDEEHLPTDFTPEALADAMADCTDFVAQCIAAGLDLSRMQSATLGHDLWLTRNRHGAGFWDRGLGDLGNGLTGLAHGMGSRDVMALESGQLVIE